MMKQSTLLAIGVICCAFAAAADAAPLFGVAPFQIGVNSSLYRVDESTGAATLIGDTGFERFGGLAFAPSGTLYGYTPGALYTLNTTTGAATRIGFLGTPAPEGGLAFQPGSGTLFAVDSTDPNDELLTINLATGAASIVGPLGAAGRDTSGLTFLPDGRLLGVALAGGLDRLIEINPTTGAAFTIGVLGPNVGLPSVGGLEFDPDSGILYYSDASNLYSVNVTSGAATLIGAHGVFEMSGLAAAVPEPVGLALLASLLMIMRRARLC
jgi:hypothetical protein